MLIAELNGRPIGFTRAHRFHERLGFRFVERHGFGQDDCFVCRLDREAYLEAGE